MVSIAFVGPNCVGDWDAFIECWYVLDGMLALAPSTLIIQIINLVMQFSPKEEIVKEHTTTPFMVFSITCRIVSLALIWGIRYLDYTNDQQLHHYCDLMNLDVQMRILNTWHGYVQ